MISVYLLLDFEGLIRCRCGVADLHCRSDLYLVDECCLERNDSLDRASYETIDRSKQSCYMKEGVVCNFPQERSHDSYKLLQIRLTASCLCCLLEQSPFGKLLEAADLLDVLTCYLYNLGVWSSVNLCVADSTKQFYVLFCLLGFQEGVNVH